MLAYGGGGLDRKCAYASGAGEAGVNRSLLTHSVLKSEGPPWGVPDGRSSDQVYVCRVGGGGGKKMCHVYGGEHKIGNILHTYEMDDPSSVKHYCLHHDYYHVCVQGGGPGR